MPRRRLSSAACAHELAALAQRLGLVELDAEPRGEQVEDVARRVVGVEVRGQRVEHATIGSSTASSAPTKRIPKSPSW